MIYQESSICNIAPITTKSNEDQIIYSIDRIKFPEEDARVVQREGSYFVSESDLYSIKSFYENKFDELEILNKISESHNIDKDKLFVILEYTLDELKSQKEAVENEKKETKGNKTRSKLHKKLSVIQKRLIKLRSKGVLSNEELKNK